LQAEIKRADVSA